MSDNIKQAADDQALQDMLAESDTGGRTPSGVSAKVLDTFMEGGAEVLADLRQATPWDLLCARLSNPRLNAVREVCATVGEGAMKSYRLLTPEEEASAELGEEDSGATAGAGRASSAPSKKG